MREFCLSTNSFKNSNKQLINKNKKMMSEKEFESWKELLVSVKKFFEKFTAH